MKNRLYKVRHYGNEEEKTYDSSEELFREIFNPDQYESYDATDDELDDEYGSIEIDGITFYASQILKALDNYTYNVKVRQNAQQYANELREEYKDQILSMGNYEQINTGEYRITCEENDENDYPEVNIQEYLSILGV